MAFSRSTLTAIRKYGAPACVKAFAMSQQGEGPHTIALTGPASIKTVSQANAAINAGREIRMKGPNRADYLTNPARKKPRTPAQRAATARMLAANKARRTPKQKAARKRKNTVKGYYPNPTLAQQRKTRTARHKKANDLLGKSYRAGGKYRVESLVGGEWKCLAQFSHKDGFGGAVDYAKALIRAGAKTQIRVHW